MEVLDDKHCGLAAEGGVHLLADLGKQQILAPAEPVDPGQLLEITERAERPGRVQRVAVAAQHPRAGDVLAEPPR